MQRDDTLPHFRGSRAIAPRSYSTCESLFPIHRCPQGQAQAVNSRVDSLSPALCTFCQPLCNVWVVKAASRPARPQASAEILLLSHGD
jgi:hypothetical protein